MAAFSLRADLHIIRQTDREGEEYFVVEDPLNGEVVVLGEKEHFLCKELERCDSVDEVPSRFTEKFGLHLDLEQLAAFIRDLSDKGLFSGIPARSLSTLELFQFRSAENWKRWNFFDPERLTLWLATSFSWCFTKAFVFFSLLIFLLATGVVFFHFNAVVSDLHRLVLPLGLFQMFAIMYLFVNIPGEMARGMTSAHFGSHANEYGLWLAYDIMPRFYCLSNVNAIASRSERSLTLFSPSFYALLAGSLGMLLWKIAASNLLLRRFGLALALLSLIDSLIRLNFLWPNEAHYILSNWLDIKNLRQRAMRYVGSRLMRRPLPEPLTQKEQRILFLYGLVTALTTLPALGVLAYFIGKYLIHSYAGIGGFFFLGIIAAKYRKGISGLFKKENTVARKQSDKGKGTVLLRYVRWSLWLIILVVVLLLPYPYEAGGNFKLLPLERVELHALVDGEVKEVLVSENTVVRKGDSQAVLDAGEHRKNLDVVRADLDKARMDLRLLEKGPKPEEVKKAQEQVSAAKTQAEFSRKEEVRLRALFHEGAAPQEEYEAAQGRAEVDEKTLLVAMANLELVKSGPHPEEIEAQRAVIRDYEAKLQYYEKTFTNTKLFAPLSGRVVTPYMEMKVGQYLKKGDLFAIYENSEEIQAEVQIPEADIPEIRVGGKVKIRPEAYPLRIFPGTVTLIASNAEDTPNGKVVRVITRIPNKEHELKPEMTGKAKIEGETRPVFLAFSKALVRFFMVEVWSWFP